MKNIAVFSSGHGSTFEYIYKQCLEHKKIKTAVLITNNKNCEAVEKAKKLDCPFYVINPKKFSEQIDWDNEVIETLKPFKIKLIILAGYLQKVGETLIDKYNIINTHPSLLPAYGGKGMYGLKIHQAVHRNHEQFTGATIHYVSPEYDEGPIIKQKKIKLSQEETPDSIQEQVKCVEKQLLWDAVLELL